MSCPRTMTAASLRFDDGSGICHSCASCLFHVPAAFLLSASPLSPPHFSLRWQTERYCTRRPAPTSNQTGASQ
eukprot:3046364-Rhodomonas_salina.1